eukprot:1136301-Pelagomonas_calceolata.AAC.7
MCVHTHTHTGNGAHEDIVVSSARAYNSALNKMIAWISQHEKQAVSGKVGTNGVGQALRANATSS